MDHLPSLNVISPGRNNSLEDQIKAIASEIVEKRTAIHDTGLLGGKAGMVLLFAYLSKLFPEEKYFDHVLSFLDDLSNSLSTDEMDHHLSAGVAGIGFVFQHLRNIGVLDDADDINLSELDEFIDQGIENDFAEANWDPLHGMTGAGIYFLERYKETGEKKYLEKIVDKLALLRTPHEKYQVWITPGYGNWSKDNYNFGIAHGMPGVLSFLAQVYEKNTRRNEIEEMINSCMPFLLQNEYDDADYSFPNAIDVTPTDQQEKQSRLAWCYGDLCMANALIHCGRSLQRDDWKTKGIEVALKTTSRNLKNSGCTDAPFCHGSTGIVHQFNRIFRLTGNVAFKQAADYWIDITMQKYYQPGEGAGGYFFRSLNEKENSFEYVPAYGLLEGSAGIALVYLSWLHDTEPGWDSIFMTNV